MAPHEGLVHPTEYKFEDSNIELIGTDIDHKVKYNSAATEPAWNNGVIGARPGLFVWRIEQFEVVPWPKDRYGTFYDGDSFIILSSEKVGEQGNERLVHDIFFWLGSKTSQDEAGTAAYKTVELDEFLQGSAIQHREIQAAPSEDFLALFPRLSIHTGGVRSGFRHVGEKPVEQRRVLLRVIKNPAAGPDGLIVHEVDPVQQSLDSRDVFVLDTGAKIWVWQGKECSPMEKAKAAQVVNDMNLTRGAEVEVVAQDEARSRRVVDLLGEGGGDEGFAEPDATPRQDFRAHRQSGHVDQSQKLLRLSDASGDLVLDLVKSTDADSAERVTYRDLDSNDVFLIDDGGKTIWVWEGSQASVAERKLWLRVAQAYLRQLPEGGQTRMRTPLVKVVDGCESRAFLRAIAV